MAAHVVRCGLEMEAGAAGPVAQCRPIKSDPLARIDLGLTVNAPLIAQLLRVADVRFVNAVPPGAVSYVIAGATLALPVAEFIEPTTERTRLTKEIANLGAGTNKLAKKLRNADFVGRTPEHVVEEPRARLAEAEATKSNWKRHSRGCWPSGTDGRCSWRCSRLGMPRQPTINRDLRQQQGFVRSAQSCPAATTSRCC
ncbi:hypothetical protein IVB36_14125 [Bradyrhizobium sp. 35]|nr:hypothetical protein [Bradyrhizobium sp. 35]